MSTRPHLEESLRRDMDAIRAKVKAMCALDEKALRDCVNALVTRDRRTAYAIILRDRNVDALEKELERLCLEFIVRQQPAAGLLRFAYATIKINSDLERIGDYAESIARQILRLLDQEVKIPVDRFKEMAGLSIPMLHDAVRAYVEEDAALAGRTMETEEAVDALKSGLARDLVALARRTDLSFENLNSLMGIGRQLERVSDQARDVCLEVLYMCTGENPRHPGADAFRVFFVDGDNACLSQMAETIANSLRLPGFVFASAGVEPKPIEPATVAFMKEKGLDLSHMAPKAINQVPDLARYDVIVTLAPEARKAFPQRPRRIVYLDWTVRDPSKKAGPPKESRAAYEKTFQFIQTNIKDLVEAILGNHGDNRSA